ncbi:GntR family transcriptional regulator [Paraburkholderia tropica]|uniref:GntR family transcriptional regulator n=1 Tax=Paraburkholderia tropica TaxID=92647 RepID=UPI002AB03091|nr:GntR family transcriptional regulator [Paraburkholderia tropica]
MPVTDRILSAIRDQITEGRLPPGTALVEQEWTQALDVSRNTLREAFRLLCREGLAVHFRHRGVVVRSLTRQDVRDIYRVRRTLELQALSRDEPFEENELGAMRDAVAQAEAAAEVGDWRTVGTHSLLFHRYIVTTLQSPLIDAFFKTILAQLRLVFASAPDERRFQKPWVVKDRRILQSIEAGQFVVAHERLTEYLTQSEHALLDHI